jgi:hypothetical protein
MRLSQSRRHAPLHTLVHPPDAVLRFVDIDTKGLTTAVVLGFDQRYVEAIGVLGEQIGACTLFSHSVLADRESH